MELLLDKTGLSLFLRKFWSEWMVLEPECPFVVRPRLDNSLIPAEPP